jgi:multiple inositol-polyphosphate phosphatase/2,3-bisphosphoglycerate 3-phosphatase
LNLCSRELSFELEHHLSTKTPYWIIDQQSSYDTSHASEFCPDLPIHINLLARHGIRFPTKGDIEDFVHLEKILSQYGYLISNSNFSWLTEWKCPYKLSESGLLTARGEREHYDLAKRLAHRFDPFLSIQYTPKILPIQSSPASRASQSGTSFAFGLLEGLGTLGLAHYQPFAIESDSDTLRFFERCPNYENNVLQNTSLLYESDMFFGKYIDSVSEKVSQILGIPYYYHHHNHNNNNNNNSSNNKNGQNDYWNLTNIMIILYKACQFDISYFNESKKFCALFDQEDFLFFEYWQDLSDYYMKGHGTPLAYEISCPLLVDFFNTMDSIVKKTPALEKAKLRFAHAETLMPFVSILGLFNDQEPLHWNSTDLQRETRQWRSSVISPFTANVIFLLYNCTDGFRVKLLHNEVAREFPGCGEMYCPLGKLRILYEVALQCNFQQMCANSSSPSHPLLFQESKYEETNINPLLLMEVPVFSFVIGFLSGIGMLNLWTVTRRQQRGYRFVPKEDH